jgi:hypothetical protein
MQIGRRVQRLERAQLAERQKMKAQSEMPRVSMDDSLEPNLDDRYQISNSQKDLVNIYTYVYENRNDPAFTVRSVSLSFSLRNLTILRITLGLYSEIKRSHTRASAQSRV